MTFLLLSGAPRPVRAPTRSMGGRSPRRRRKLATQGFRFAGVEGRRAASVRVGRAGVPHVRATSGARRHERREHLWTGAAGGSRDAHPTIVTGGSPNVGATRGNPYSAAHAKGAL